MKANSSWCNRQIETPVSQPRVATGYAEGSDETKALAQRGAPGGPGRERASAGRGLPRPDGTHVTSDTHVKLVSASRLSQGRQSALVPQASEQDAAREDPPRGSYANHAAFGPGPQEGGRGQGGRARGTRTLAGQERVAPAPEAGPRAAWRVYVGQMSPRPSSTRGRDHNPWWGGGRSNRSLRVPRLVKGVLGSARPHRAVLMRHHTTGQTPARLPACPPAAYARPRKPRTEPRGACLTRESLSSRQREMTVPRKASCAAMMWSRSCARCTLFHSSSQEHSSTCGHKQTSGVAPSRAAPSAGRATSQARAARPYLEGHVILHLVDEMDHLGRQDVAVVQHPGELCKRTGCHRPTTDAATARRRPSHLHLPRNKPLASTPEPFKQEAASPAISAQCKQGCSYLIV